MRKNKKPLWRRIIAAVTTAAVFSGAGTACFAAVPSLTATFDKTGLQVEIAAQAVPDDIYAAQVTIPVSQNPGPVSVTPADTSSVCEIRQIDGNIVLYLDNANTAISNNGSIAFGTISAAGAFSVGNEAQLLLADKLLQGANFTVQLDVRKAPSSSSSGGSSSGGSDNAVSSDTAVKPTIDVTAHGSVKVSADGNSITIVPDAGYEIADVFINGKSVGAVSSYTFDQDDKSRKVKVIFQLKTETKAAAVFSDVSATHWAKGAIDYVVANQLFFGTDADKFSPDDNMTRAMFVTVMSRFAPVLGEAWALPSAPSDSFRDVPADAWYAQAVSWGKGANLVSGMEEGIFAPDAPVTREQIAVLLVRYADLCGIALPQKEQPASFTDGDTISPYAQEAVRKAQMAGILRGREQGNFAPQAYATRAEVAAMLERFIKAVS